MPKTPVSLRLAGRRIGGCETDTSREGPENFSTAAICCQDAALRVLATGSSEFYVLSTPSAKRAQGMPDAGRTREPCVQKAVHSAHASDNRAAGTTGTPCAMGLRLIRALPGVRAR